MYLNDVDNELLNVYLAIIDWESLFNSYDNDCHMQHIIFQSFIDNFIDQYVSQ